MSYRRNRKPHNSAPGIILLLLLLAQIAMLTVWVLRLTAWGTRCTLDATKRGAINLNDRMNHHAYMARYTQASADLTPDL
jgi:Na+/pantothenate symporter